MSPRKTIARLGARRRTVRVFIESDGGLVRVQWRRDGRLLTRSYPNTRAGQTEAKAFARGLAESGGQRRAAPGKSLRDVWSAYADDQFPHLRERSRHLYREYWLHWEAMWGRTFVAESTTRVMISEFRKALDARGLAPATVGESIRTVRRVYRWAEDAKLIARNEVEGYRYKVAKERRPVAPDEYRADEFTQLLASFRPALASQWRPYVAIALCGFQGARQHSVLHLRWEDIDLAARQVVWRSTWDKLGREWTQPLRDGAIAALRIAKQRQDGPWVLHSASSKNRRPTYSAQSLWAALKAAEHRADVANKPRRAAHGLRRLLAGEVNAATGDATLALLAIGDTDIRMATRYLKKRDDRVRAAFDQLDADANRNATVTAPTTPEKSQSQATENQ